MGEALSLSLIWYVSTLGAHLKCPYPKARGPGQLEVCGPTGITGCGGMLAAGALQQRM